jgi:anti-sigma-K factor RskA
MSDPLLARLEALGPDEWRPEPPPALVMPPETYAAPRRRALTLRPLPALAAVLLLLALGAGGALVATDRDQDRPPGRALALSPLQPGGAAQGQVRLARAGGRATLKVSGLAPSRRGEFYELWLLSPPGDLVSLGSFRVSTGGRATLQVPLPVDPSRYRFLDVSVEPDDGDPAHSSRSILRGRT